MQQPSVLLVSCWPGSLQSGFWTSGQGRGVHCTLIESWSHWQLLQPLVQDSPDCGARTKRVRLPAAGLDLHDGLQQPHLFGSSIRSNTV